MIDIFCVAILSVLVLTPRPIATINPAREHVLPCRPSYHAICTSIPPRLTGHRTLPMGDRRINNCLTRNSRSVKVKIRAQTVPERRVPHCLRSFPILGTGCGHLAVRTFSSVTIPGGPRDSMLQFNIKARGR